MFKDIDSDYYIFGHEHKSSYYRNKEKHYFCLDSFGLKNPGSYLLIDVKEDKIELEERFVGFNIEEEIELMEEACYPYNKGKISWFNFCKIYKILSDLN